MKFDIKEAVGSALAVFCGNLVLDLAKFEYNPFMDGFVWWKVVVRLGTPVLFLALWLAIYHLASRLQNK